MSPIYEQFATSSDERGKYPDAAGPASVARPRQSAWSDGRSGTLRPLAAASPARREPGA
jgi:hypothetical protein